MATGEELAKETMAKETMAKETMAKETMARAGGEVRVAAAVTTGLEEVETALEAPAKVLMAPRAEVGSRWQAGRRQPE